MTKEEQIQEAFKKGITVDIETGQVFTKKGKPYSSKTVSGYGVIPLFIKGKRYYITTHRMVFYKAWGYLPRMIDHINRNPLDNRIDNLRPTTHTQNGQNREVRGCYKKGDKWQAQIKEPGGKLIYLGLYETQEEASKVYQSAKKIYHNI